MTSLIIQGTRLAFNVNGCEFHNLLIIAILLAAKGRGLCEYLRG